MNAFEIILENLSRKNDAFTLEGKKRHGVISELAYEYAKKWSLSEKSTEFLSSIGEELAGCFVHDCLYADTVFFADRLIMHVMKFGKKPSFYDFFGRWENSRCACVKNRYTDMAYEKFASLVPDMTVKYVDDTDDVFYALSQKNADCAIIPTHSAFHGSFSGMYDKIDENDLIISSQYSAVQTNSDTLTLSLVSERLLPDLGGEYVMDVRFYISENYGADIILGAVGYFGCFIQFVLSSDGEGYRLSVIGTYDELYKLLVYLKIFTCGVYTFGIFKRT